MNGTIEKQLEKIVNN